MLTVYPARSVITMNPSQPRAEAVAVRNDRIVEVGTLTSMKPWLDVHEHFVDDRFANDVIVHKMSQLQARPMRHANRRHQPRQ